MLGDPMPRRSFLSGLASLPLIGGSVALLGRPSGVAAPVTLDLMDAYKTWLDLEQRLIAAEIADHPTNVASYAGMTRTERFDFIERFVHMNNGAAKFHRYDGTDPASGRAALVLSAVGCDWRDGTSRRRRA